MLYLNCIRLTCSACMARVAGCSVWSAGHEEDVCPQLGHCHPARHCHAHSQGRRDHACDPAEDPNGLCFATGGPQGTEERPAEGAASSDRRMVARIEVSGFAACSNFSTNALVSNISNLYPLLVLIAGLSATLMRARSWMPSSWLLSAKAFLE